MKITIGIPTYNRKELLQIMAKSLYDSYLPETVHIRVYDDSSTDYEADFLDKLFPTAVTVVKNRTNLNADKNMFLMYRDFLESGDDYFFNADSDIIFNSEWLAKGMELIQETDGVLSLFHTKSHPLDKAVSHDLVVKKSIGAAGTLFKREVIEKIMARFDQIEMVNSFDWQWSKYLNDNDIQIYCVKNSLIQHLGFTGQNSKLYFDVGRNFKVETIEQGQILNDILLQSNDKIREREKNRHIELQKKNAIVANDFWYHAKRCFIIILKTILPKAWYSKLMKR